MRVIWSLLAIDTVPMPDEKLGKQSIERDVLAALRFGGLDKQNVTELVQVVSVLNREGIRPLRVFPIGIPAPDGVGVQTNLTLKGLRILVDLLAKIERINHVEVFPLGIPAIDQFMTRISVR